MRYSFGVFPMLNYYLDMVPELECLYLFNGKINNCQNSGLWATILCSSHIE